MKKLLLFTLMLVITSATFSQINKGNFIVGGNAGFSSYKSSGADAASFKGTTVTFSPNAGYFIFSKAAAGLRLGLTSFKSNIPGGNSSTTTDFTFSPFVRYYFLEQKNNVHIFADASFNHTSQKTKYSSSSSTNKANGFTIATGPSVFLNPHVALEFTVGYNYSKSKGFDSKVNTFQTGVGFQIHLSKIKSGK